MSRFDPVKFNILKNLDVKAARPMFKAQMFPVARDKCGKTVPEDEVILASLHQARLQLSHMFSPAEIYISRNWLAMNGYGVNA